MQILILNQNLSCQKAKIYHFKEFEKKLTALMNENK